jgi:hypothetical protein
MPPLINLQLVDLFKIIESWQIFLCKLLTRFVIEDRQKSVEDGQWTRVAATLPTVNVCLSYEF